MTQLEPPAASAGREALADWIELQAILSDDGNASLQDLLQAIRISGTAEAIPDTDQGTLWDDLSDSQFAPGNALMADDDEYLDEDDVEDTEVDRGSEKSEQVAQDAWAEIENRSLWCGSENGGYPFVVESDYIALKDGWMRIPYIFMLLISHTGIRNRGEKKQRTNDAPKIFEHLSLEAASHYLGGPSHSVQRYELGYPRKLTAPQFEKAVNKLCSEIGEGEGCRTRPTLKNAKDATLDLVVWRAFPDGRVGQLIGFGQCAAGSDWESKLSHLQPRNFCDLWLLEAPSHPPIRMFFMPHVIREHIWADRAKVGGIMFDRCRIAANTLGAGKELLDSCEVLVQRIIKEEVPLAA